MQVKDVLYHLYKTSSGNLQRLVPKEMRILKYLLTIEDPEERMSALNDAFTPGEELQGMDVDCLYTCVFELQGMEGSRGGGWRLGGQGNRIQVSGAIGTKNNSRRLYILHRKIKGIKLN